MKNQHLLLIIALLLGMLLGSRSPVPNALAGEGEWICYITHKMDNMEKSPTYGEPKMVAAALNQKAPGASRGTVVPLIFGTGNGFLGLMCIKE